VSAVDSNGVLGGRALEVDRVEARYADLLQFAPLGLAVTDENGVVRELNAAAAEILGVEARFMIGKPLVAFIPPPGRRDFRSALIELARRPGPRRWQLDLLARDGAAVHVRVTAAPAGAATPPGDLRWAFEDVTEDAVREQSVRRLASELETRALERTAELEEQHALLEAVIENMPAGVILVSREGVPTTANGEALRILGLPSMDALKALRSEDIEGYRVEGGARVGAEEWPLARTLATGAVVRGERYELVAEGRHVIVDVSSAPIMVGDEANGALVVLRDVTVQEQAERAEREFVTNAAHELQSPLAAIVSTVEVLQAGAKEGPQRDVFLGHIEREADRLARLVRALLILARSQMGLEAPRDELVALCPLLTDVGSALRLANGVELEVDCNEHLAVLTNRELLEQAVVNLAQNAAKHTSAGRIVLGAAEVEGPGVEITVTDTGPGIAAAERPRIFERFYRAEDEPAGFGLGLAIVRAVAEALEGDLELDSTVGAGTIFRLRLPHAAALVSA
jgi:PAS domain S-box-containing protein